MVSFQNVHVSQIYLEEWVMSIMNDGDTADIVFLDFIKVFNSVNHYLLLHKHNNPLLEIKPTKFR